MRQLTEPQAWRHIARAITAPEYDGTGWLCCRVDDMGGNRRAQGLISDETYYAMRARVRSYLEKDGALAYGNMNTACAPYYWPRALAALWLALDAEAEGR